MSHRIRMSKDKQNIFCRMWFHPQIRSSAAQKRVLSKHLGCLQLHVFNSLLEGLNVLKQNRLTQLNLQHRKIWSHFYRGESHEPQRMQQNADFSQKGELRLKAKILEFLQNIGTPPQVRVGGTKYHELKQSYAQRAVQCERHTTPINKTQEQVHWLTQSTHTRGNRCLLDCIGSPAKV